MEATLNSVGVVLVFAGVIFLFNFAFSYREWTGPQQRLVERDWDGLGPEGKFDSRTKIGIALVVLGTLCIIVLRLEAFFPV